MSRPRAFGSLFAGIGGFDLGFERAGFRTAWQVEIDAAASSVLARHWPDVTRYADVREIDGGGVEPVDVITFGSPCQDLSVAGQRRGFAGERSGLFFEAVRIIREMRDATDGRCPAFALWENVPGALSSDQGRDFGSALDALAECGAMDIAWRVLDSQWFGLAQRRERLFTVADFGGERAGQVLALSQSLRGDSPPRRTAGEDAAGCLGGGPQAGGWHGDLDSMGAYVPALGYGRNGHGGSHGRIDGESETFIAHTLRAEGFDASEDGTGRGTPLVLDWQLSCSVSEFSPSLVTERTPAVMLPTHAIHTTGHQGDRVNDFNGVWTTLPAQNANNGGGAGALLLHGMTVRRLTPRECERLQGFPDGFTRERADGKEQADGPRYRQLGNAVSVSVAYWIARNAREALRTLGREAVA